MEDWAAADIFAALGHPTRVRLLRMLLAAGERGIAAGALADSLNVAPSTLSHHLTTLEHQGLIGHQRRQRSLIYRAEDAQLRRLIAYLIHECCEGDPGRCGFPVGAPVPAPC